MSELSSLDGESQEGAQSDNERDTRSASNSKIQAKQACDLCKRRKARCMGGIPCRRCIESNTQCIPATGRARSIPERLASLEEQQKSTKSTLETALRTIDRLQSLLKSSCNTLGTDHHGFQHSAAASGVTSPSPWSAASAYDHEHEEGSVRDTKKRKRSKHDSASSDELEAVAFQIFQKRCAHMFPFIESNSLQELSSMMKHGESLYYWSIIAVGSREAKELSSVHERAMKQVIEKSRQSPFGDRPTLDIIKGLMIVWIWLSVSRSPGYLVAVAHELRLGIKCQELYRDWQIRQMLQEDDPLQSAQYRERLRIYGYLLVLDRLWSMMSGSPRLLPPVSSEGMFQSLLEFHDTPFPDIILLAQVEVSNVIAKAQDAILPGGQRVVGPERIESLECLVQYNQDIDDWYSKWSAYIGIYKKDQRGGSQRREQAEEASTSLAFMRVRGLTCKVYLNLFALLGLTINDEITAERMQFAWEAVKHAREICAIAVKLFQPPIIMYTSNFTQMQVCYSVVALLRLLRFFPGMFEEDSIVKEIRELAELLDHVSGQYFAKRIFVMLENIQMAATRGEDDEAQQPNTSDSASLDFWMGIEATPHWI